MAFFLLMWLLGSTTEGDKQGHRRLLQFAAQGRAASAAAARATRRTSSRAAAPTSRARSARSSSGDIEAPRKTVNLQALQVGAEAQAERARLEAAQDEGRGGARNNAEAGVDALADPPRHDAGRPAHPDRRRAEPADVRQRQRGREAVHARAAAQHRRACWPRCRTASRWKATPMPAVRQRRPRLQQLGAVDRPRQRVAPRAGRRRPARGPRAAGAGPGLELAASTPAIRSARRTAASASS